MREEVMTVQELVIVAERDKLRPVNEMASVSARTFSVADAERYAGPSTIFPEWRKTLPA